MKPVEVMNLGGFTAYPDQGLLEAYWQDVGAGHAALCRTVIARASPFEFVAGDCEREPGVPDGGASRGLRHRPPAPPDAPDDSVQVLEASRDPHAIADLQRLCGRSARTRFRDQVVRPLLDRGLLAMTIPDEPTSSRQWYRATEAGEKVLSK